MREDVVEEARLWLGTPYLHQASVRGAGADCLGLIRGIWRKLYREEPTTPPSYTPDWDETERFEILRTAAGLYLREVKRDPEPGDVILFRMRHGMVAKHLGVVSQTRPTPRFIHAYQGHGVVESPFSLPWRRRAVGFYEFR